LTDLQDRKRALSKHLCRCFKNHTKVWCIYERDIGRRTCWL